MEMIARLRDREEALTLQATDRGYRIEIGDRTYEVDSVAFGQGVYSLRIDGQQYEVATHSVGDGQYDVLSTQGEDRVELMDPLTHLALAAHGDASGGGIQKVTAYMPGQVVEILVEEGEAVSEGQGILVLEAMKMKNEIRCERAGVVQRILVQAGVAVEGGDPLFEIGPAE